MTFVQIVGILRAYRADVLLLAFGVTLLTSVLKKTVFRSLGKKALVFVPFGIGLLLYTAFRLLTTLAWTPLTEELFATLEAGFSCGCVATLYYAVWKQFTKPSLSPLLPMLEFLPEERRNEAASALYEGAKGLSFEERVPYFEEALKTYCEPPMSEEELHETALLLAEFLKELGV